MNVNPKRPEVRIVIKTDDELAQAHYVFLWPDAFLPARPGILEVKGQSIATTG